MLLKEVLNYSRSCTNYCF